MSVKLTDLKLSRFTLLQTAQSGHGKTTRSLTATRFGKVYVMDFDGKISGAARGLPSGLSADLNAVDVDDFSGQAFDDALKKLKELVALKDKIEYATVIIDTFTALNDKVYTKALGAKLETGEKAEFSEWGKIDNLLTNFFNLLRQLPCNIIVNCHIDETTDEVSKRVRYGQAGRGGFRNKLAGWFTDSHYLAYDLGKYQVKVKNSDTFPVNTNIDPKFIDKSGVATVFDLSIFDDYAFRVKEAK
jgi:hypothetical protein